MSLHRDFNARLLVARPESACFDSLVVEDVRGKLFGFHNNTEFKKILIYLASSFKSRAIKLGVQWYFTIVVSVYKEPAS